MRGSKYELKFDFKGQPTNEEEIRNILKKKGQIIGPIVSTKKQGGEEEKMDLSWWVKMSVVEIQQA